MSSILYECVRCGRTATKEEWERGQPKLDEWEVRERERLGVSSQGGAFFKCPTCGYRVAKKMRPPIAKRIKTV